MTKQVTVAPVVVKDETKAGRKRTPKPQPEDIRRSRRRHRLPSRGEISEKAGQTFQRKTAQRAPSRLKPPRGKPSPCWEESRS